jgi:uncharacterized protein YyaL (SSP411 family)
MSTLLSVSAPRLLPTLAAFASALFFAACGDEQPADGGEAATVPETLRRNQLAGTPSTFLANAAASPIHWQRWNPEVLETARRANRPLFVIAGSARYPGCFETLRAIERKPALVRRLNEDFVPVLVDIEICRETALLASSLSAESNQPISFPFVFLVSPSGAPISWQPVNYADDRSVYEFFDNSASVVARLWQESPDYVKDDSRRKLESRQEAEYQPLPTVGERGDRETLYRSASRRLNSFYDEDIRTLFGSGGIFPHGLLDALALAAVNPELPADQREDSRSSLEGLLATLLASGMVDPLDGGIYRSRRLPTWYAPSRLRDCPGQARAIGVLSRISGLGLAEDALPVALRAAAFAEERFQLKDGLFSVCGVPGPSPDKEWMWTLDQLREALDKDEAKLWIEISASEELGNLPSESDPRRRYFRLNSLAVRHSPEDAAARVGLDPGRARALFESGREKLLAAREARFPAPELDATPSARASFRMISAYAWLFTATGDEAWLTKAVALGERCREAFGGSRFLNERPGENPEEMSDGRAFTYALAITAALDLGAVTLDDAWNLWAQDLLTLLGENFVAESGKLVEARPEVRVIPISYEDRSMVFTESTAGLLAINLGRLRALGFETPPGLQSRIHALPPVHRRPIVHTDFIRSLALEFSRHTLAIGPEGPEPIRRRALTLPLESFERRASEAAGAAVRVTAPDGETTAVESADALEALIPTRARR